MLLAHAQQNAGAVVPAPVPAQSGMAGAPYIARAPAYVAPTGSGWAYKLGRSAMRNAGAGSYTWVTRKPRKYRRRTKKRRTKRKYTKKKKT